MHIPTVVIVEDSPTQAKLIASQLAKYGVITVIADDGLAGLRAVYEYQPDLVVLDVNLPTMDGFQVCYRLKRDPDTAHVPVVMLTVEADAEETLVGLDMGADDYIPKDGFATENLIVTLQTMGLI